MPITDQKISDEHTKYQLDSEVPIIGSIGAKPSPQIRFRDIASQIRIEINLGVPNIYYLIEISNEMLLIYAENKDLLENDFAKSIKNLALGESQITFKGEMESLVSEATKALRKKVAETNAERDAAEAPISGPSDQAQPKPVSPLDTPPTKEEDQPMSTTTDKDYIDSRLETISTKMLGEVRAITVEMAGERKAYEAKMEGNIGIIREMIDKRLAEANADRHKSSMDTFKWLATIIVSLAALSMAYMTYLANTASPKAPPAPIIIYAQPAPAATPPVAPTTK